MANIFNFKASGSAYNESLQIHRFENSFTIKSQFLLLFVQTNSLLYTQQDHTKTIVLLSGPINSSQFVIKNLYTKTAINYRIQLNNSGASGTSGRYYVPITDTEKFNIAEKFIIGFADKGNRTEDYTLFSAVNDTAQAEINFIDDNKKIIYISKNTLLKNADTKINADFKNENLKSFLNIYIEIKPLAFSIPGIAQTQGPQTTGVMFDEIERLITARYPSITSESPAIIFSQDIFITGEFL